MRAPGVETTDHVIETPDEDVLLGRGATADAAAAGVTSQTRTLWARRLRLASGRAIIWGHDHFDQVLWVRSGSLISADGDLVGAHDAFVVEDGVVTKLIAQADCEVVIFGTRAKPTWSVLGPPTGARSAYVIPAAERSYTSTTLPGDVNVETRFWADSTRPSSRAALLQVGGDGAHKAPNHFHTHDEIIYVIEGAITVGQARLSTDSSIYVPANQWYRYSAEGPYRFINFRPDASRIVFAPGTDGMLETVAGLAAGPAL